MEQSIYTEMIELINALDVEEYKYQYLILALKKALELEKNDRVNFTNELIELIQIETDNRITNDITEDNNRLLAIQYAILLSGETKESILSKLGADKLSGNNTGDETADSIINKLGFEPIHDCKDFIPIGMNNCIGSLHLLKFNYSVDINIGNSEYVVGKITNLNNLIGTWKYISVVPYYTYNNTQYLDNVNEPITMINVFGYALLKRIA